MNRLTDLCVVQNAGKFTTCWENIDLSRRVMQHGISWLLSYNFNLSISRFYSVSRN